MPHISDAHRRRMSNAYDHAVAMFLAARAMRERTTITYGALSERFGRSPRGWGDVLGGIAIRCHKAGFPILSTIVVNAVTGRPSEDALLYIDLGLDTPEKIDAEQVRCFDFDWSRSPLAPRNP